ncbi:hypothetical protein [Amycolatopsis nigrescens]|uniref:hypothetical protein n=1 Tax=Amycolatopsis nigrescens TaxID=381445 RepID=UPI00035EE9DE|nr:hypothetical protein [Amycolatopsis nigrescens]
MGGALSCLAHRVLGRWATTLRAAVLLGLVVVGGLAASMMLLRSAPAVSLSVSVTVVASLIVAMLTGPRHRARL